MINKVPLSSGSVTGGLKLLEQKYTFFYLPKEGELPSKIEIAITLEKDGQQREYTSLRFQNMAQMRSMIHNLIKAYVFYGRVEGLISHSNYGYKMNEVLKFVTECFRADPNKLKNYRA